MSFSSLRRWFSHPNTSAAEATSTPPGAAGAQAQFLKALQFASGEGMAQDYAQAAQCYALAAEQNHSLAQFNLATLYGQGQGVKRDDAKSQMWLAKAANLGNAAAQYRLGVRKHLVCREQAAGAAAESRIEALKWVRLSANQGCPGAANACQFVALGMTREEVTEGARRAASFVAGVSA